MDIGQSEQFSFQLDNINAKNIENEYTPLSIKLRPTFFDDFVGQKHILNKVNNINKNSLVHYIFHGPPGSGKTTLANILAKKLERKIYLINAVTAGVAELRKLIETAIQYKQNKNTPAIIFIDEIHRFNKASQDALLPYLENGDFQLIGATTESPKIYFNKALLSRVYTLELFKLNQEDLFLILSKAKNHSKINVNDELIKYICYLSNGDARIALNYFEMLHDTYGKDWNIITKKQVDELFINQSRSFDRNEERHYDTISAFIKSIRGSDPDSALLWLAVMLDGKMDPLFITRRLIILASEDIGLADPTSLTMALNAHNAIKEIGMPEGRINLSHVVIHLSLAPKSNKAYLAINNALNYIKSKSTIEVPTHLRNHHPDKKNYRYPHDYPNSKIDQFYGIKKGTFLN